MQVKDHLPAVSIAVNDQPVTVLRDTLVPGQLRRHHEQMAQVGFVTFRYVIHRRYRLVGHDQDMGRGLGVDIPERSDTLVPVYDVRFGFAVYDFAENGFFRHYTVPVESLTQRIFTPRVNQVMSTFKAYRIHNEDGEIKAEFDQISLDDVTEGDVVIRSAYSDINYKDALAATGKGKILRKYPLVGGIDVAGHVESSSSEQFKAGEAVVVCGCELSETRDGGYAEFVRVPADCVVKLPDSLTLFDAMSLGTAGFTAALAVERMEQNDQNPDHGMIVVTGATGGVGSVAVDILSGAGYEVAAVTGKADAAEYLRDLGASHVLLRDELDLGKRPMERAEWGGAVDNLGGEILTWLTRTVKPFGNIACIGLAASHELTTTVMPLILRGVSLLGINSVLCPPKIRQTVWDRLGSDLKPRHLDRIVTRTIDFDELPGAFDEYVKGTVTGRTVVKIADPD